ncbi:MAG: hypothetical protein ABSD62_07365 [Candidatus Limnocylindrales bacterium]
MSTPKSRPGTDHPAAPPRAARGRRPASELAALRGRIEGFMLAGLRSPAIHRALTGPECPNPVIISERQVRAHMRAIERSWSERASGEALEADRAKAIAMVEEVGRVALTRSTMHAGSNVGVGYLNAYLKASERYARLRGLDAPVRTEIAGPDGGPVALIALADHPAEHLDPREEARRLRAMAADAEAEADALEGDEGSEP